MITLPYSLPPSLPPDNALYRVGSQHIAPLFSKSPSHRKRTDTYEYPDNSVIVESTSIPTKNKNLDEMLTSSGSNPYDTPREVLDSNTYSIPTSIPVMDNYVNHAVVTQVSVEPSKGSFYKHPQKGMSHGEEGHSEGVDGSSDQKVESGDYIYMSSLPDDEGEKESNEPSFSPEEV